MTQLWTVLAMSKQVSAVSIYCPIEIISFCPYLEEQFLNILGKSGQILNGQLLKQPNMTYSRLV